MTSDPRIISIELKPMYYSKSNMEMLLDHVKLSNYRRLQCTFLDLLSEATHYSPT